MRTGNGIPWGRLAALLLLLAMLPFAGASAEEMNLTDWVEEAPATVVPTSQPTATPAPTAASGWLTFDETEKTINQGKGFTLQPIAHGDLNIGSRTRYTWSTSKSDIAVVSDKGRVTGKGGGTCKVWCSVTVDGISYTAECTVTVLVSVSGIKARDESVVMVAGETRELSFTVRPDDATDRGISLTSDEPEVVAVNADGSITALAAGTAKITAQALDGSGKKASTTVRVATLQPEALENTISLRTGGSVNVRYIGSVSSFARNISVSTKAKCFSVTPEFDEDGLRLVVEPLAVGEDTVTLKDSRSSATPVTITIRIDNQLPSPTVPAVETAALDGDTVQVAVVNHGDADIISYSLRYAFFDGEGQQLFAGDSGRLDFAGELVSLEYMGSIPAGERAEVWDFLVPAYADAAAMRVAVDGYRTADGIRWAVPDNSLRWVDSLLGEVDARGIAPEAVPADDDTDWTEALGFSAVMLPAGFAEHYGYDRPGCWVTVVTDGTPADKAGLRQGDLIFAADDVEWADDPFILTAAARSLAEGSRVELQAERGGKTVRLNLRP